MALILNTPYKDNKFGTLYGDWDESSFMLEFDELIIRKQDDFTYHGYGVLTDHEMMTNKQKKEDPNKFKFLAKFTLHKSDWTYKTKKDDKWVEQSMKPTTFEQMFIFQIEHQQDLYLNPQMAVAGKITAHSPKVVKDLWEHYQKAGRVECPPGLAPFLGSYPIFSFDSVYPKELVPYLDEINQSVVAKESGNGKGKYEVNRIQKLKELYSEYTDTPLANISIFGIRAELVSWKDEDLADYRVFMDLANLLVK